MKQYEHEEIEKELHYVVLLDDADIELILELSADCLQSKDSIAFTVQPINYHVH